ncbi:hypothetical protein T11_4393 [Trichinella zimbabwensis]|uniref:Uncharacterized protein n=1 Tax=Trichinella zimbabwensis TaxID=268475 RepID=A0A0V1GIP1_9BILA|nr:hypothetical protein T11_4393 [Trichinella zimbabwensis]
MEENRLAQNNEILHKTRKLQRIPHYNMPFIRHVRVCMPWNFPEPINFS